MRTFLLSSLTTLAIFNTAQAASGTGAFSSSVALTVSVVSACVLMGGPATPDAVTSLRLKCTRDSTAPQHPLEVVAAPIADWQLTAHDRSPDGGELFTYTRGTSPLDAAVTVDFY